MHIIIAVITAIASLLWALNRLQNSGVDLNAFNPFTWVRRRKWEKQLGVKPMHALQDSMEAAALLIVSVAKVDGEITRDSKMGILQAFEEEFGISRKRSLELFSSSTYLLRDVLDMPSEVRHVISPSKADYQSSHVEKLLKMMQKIAELEGGVSPVQADIIEAVKREFELNREQPASW